MYIFKLNRFSEQIINYIMYPKSIKTKKQNKTSIEISNINDTRVTV